MVNYQRVLHGTVPYKAYFVGIFPYIGLTNGPKIYRTYLQFRFLKWPLRSDFPGFARSRI